MNDLELLRRYGRDDAQEAFATLVARHLNLVYSAVRRQVRSAELAQEVTQNVFVELSHHALRLPEGTHVAGWLYVLARRRAIDAIRRETSRAAREKTAVELAVMNAPPPDWTALESCLDQALLSLRARDRQAVLLRFFENRSFREIGELLGISEDGAQKRLGRALDRLRTALVRRGVSTTATALATGLARHAVQAAPGGLGASIGAAVAAGGGPLAASALGGVAGSVVSWLGRHAVSVGAAALAVVALIGASRVTGQQERQIALLESRRTALAAVEAQRNLARAQANDRNANSSPSAPAPSDVELRLRELFARVGLLRAALDRVSGARTPEIAFLEEKDWLLAAQQSWDPSSEAGVRHGLGFLQLYGRYRLGPLVSEALNRFQAANPTRRLADASELNAFFSPPIDPAILARFTVSAVSPGSAGDARVRLRLAASDFDSEADRILQVTSDGWSLSPVGFMSGALRRQIPRKFQDAGREAAIAYERAHPGQPPTRLEDLASYFSDPHVAEAVLSGSQNTTTGAKGLSPEDAAIATTVDRAVKAYRAAHEGEPPPTFAALAPYFESPEAAERFRALAQRRGKVLP